MRVTIPSPILCRCNNGHQIIIIYIMLFSFTILKVSAFRFIKGTLGWYKFLASVCQRPYNLLFASTSWTRQSILHCLITIQIFRYFSLGINHDNKILLLFLGLEAIIQDSSKLKSRMFLKDQIRRALRSSCKFSNYISDQHTTVVQSEKCFCIFAFKIYVELSIILIH